MSTATATTGFRAPGWGALGRATRKALMAAVGDIDDGWFKLNKITRQIIAACAIPVGLVIATRLLTHSWVASAWVGFIAWGVITLILYREPLVVLFVEIGQLADLSEKKVARLEEIRGTIVSGVAISMAICVACMFVPLEKKPGFIPVALLIAAAGILGNMYPTKLRLGLVATLALIVMAGILFWLAFREKNGPVSLIDVREAFSSKPAPPAIHYGIVDPVNIDPGIQIKPALTIRPVSFNTAPAPQSSGGTKTVTWGGPNGLPSGTAYRLDPGECILMQMMPGAYTGCIFKWETDPELRALPTGEPAPPAQFAECANDRDGFRVWPESEFHPSSLRFDGSGHRETSLKVCSGN